MPKTVYVCFSFICTQEIKKPYPILCTFSDDVLRFITLKTFFTFISLDEMNNVCIIVMNPLVIALYITGI